MTYSIITPTDNADFFAQFKTFVVSAGWTIDAQNDTELYVHSGDKYLGFRMGNIYARRVVLPNVLTTTDLFLNFFTCTVNSGYDNSKDYFNQPNSSINNINISTQSIYNSVTYPKTMHGIFCNNITEVVFAGDAENIIVRTKRGSSILDILIVTELSKTYNFTGGMVLCSTNALHGITATAGSSSTFAWLFQNYGRYTTGAAPFEYGYRVPNYFVQTQFVTSLLFNGTWVLSCVSESALSILFLTNAISTIANSATRSLCPFSPINSPVFLSDLSMYTGLNPLVTTEFFYKNSNSYVNTGHIEKLKLITKKNIVDKQELSYGAKTYLILNPCEGTDYPSGIISSVAFLAIEL